MLSGELYKKLLATSDFKQMTISYRTRRLLWMRSGGYCQNPGCHSDLIILFTDGTVSTIDELAHIIGQSVNGPRGESEMNSDDRDEYDNIILLCPTCHTLADKNPSQFPVEMLLEWKHHHEESIRQVFQVPVYSDRRLLASDVHRLLRVNKSMFMQYGPHSAHASDPLSGAAAAWNRHVLSDVIPNNRKIINLLKANEALLDDKELDVLDAFVLHHEAFEYNHISGDKSEVAPLFPEGMNSIMRD